MGVVSSDEQYLRLQEHLLRQSDAGDVIAGTGGLRKIPQASAGKGKRGGSRVIYFNAVSQSKIRLLLICRTGIKDDLTPKEKSVLRKSNPE